MSKTWTLDEALKLIRYLQPILHQQGWHVALGGGVLNKGFSEKDLDLYFFPFGDNKSEKTGIGTKSLERWLELMWGKGEEISFYHDKQGDPFIEKKKYYLPDEKRIDVFIGAKKQSVWKRLAEKLSTWKYGGRTMMSQMVHDENSEIF